MSPRTGRPKSDNPKNVRLEISLTEMKAKKLANCADKLGITRTAVILKGIDKIYQEIGCIEKK